MYSRASDAKTDVKFEKKRERKFGVSTVNLHGYWPSDNSLEDLRGLKDGGGGNL